MFFNKFSKLLFLTNFNLIYSAKIICNYIILRKKNMQMTLNFNPYQINKISWVKLKEKNLSLY